MPFTNERAADIEPRIRELVRLLEFDHIDPDRVHCRRSHGSTARAYARVWELPSIWQHALDIRPQYVLEVLSEHFDEIDDDEQTKILIHELLHIPKTFSGALRGHRGAGEPINGHTVNRYFRQVQRAIQAEAAASGKPQLTLPL